MTTSVAFQLRPAINGGGGGEMVACGRGAARTGSASSVSISLYETNSTRTGSVKAPISFTAAQELTNRAPALFAVVLGQLVDVHADEAVGQLVDIVPLRTWRAYSKRTLAV